MKFGYPRRWLEHIYGKLVPSIVGTSELRQAIYWKSFDTERIAFEVKYSKKMSTVLAFAGRAVAKRYRDHSEAEALSILPDVLSSPLSEVFKDLTIEVGIYFGRRILKQLFATKAADPWDTWDPLQSNAMRDWFAKTAGKKITGITRSTSRAISSEIEDALINGLGIEGVASRLSSLYSFSEERAIAIAQTEVVAASNASSYYASLQFQPPGTTLLKTWLATRDARTRSSHRRANGQEVPMDQPFEVGGSFLNFPGDPSLGAAASELTRCRCTTTFEYSR